MNVILFALALIFSLAPAAPAKVGLSPEDSSQEGLSAEARRAKEEVVEWLSEKEHDFGAIRKGRPVRYAFQFKNATSEPIILETVRTSCGCTAAEWPEAPIGPGEIGQIDIEYDAYQGGAFRKKIRVFFAQQKKPEILWISGEAE